MQTLKSRGSTRMENLKHTFNEFGQPVGLPVPQWVAPPHPARVPMLGGHCRLEPLRAEQHGLALHAAYSEDSQASSWTYLPYGPFPTADAYLQWLRERQESVDPLFFAICNHGGRPLGLASYLRIAPREGCI